MLTTRLSLIARLRDPADKLSWADFTELYKPLLLNYVRKKGLRDHDADDVVQNILVQLVRAMPGFELDHARGRFRTFLWQVTNNAVIDWFRRKGKAGAECALGDHLAEVEAAASSEPDPEWIDEERKRVMAFALERVRASSQPKTWACFDLHILQARPAADVARDLEMTANAVYVCASRILAKVREKCAEYAEDPADG